jgi:hypothetical protein
MNTHYYIKSIIISTFSFLYRVYHLYCFFYFSFSFSKKRLLRHFLSLLLKSSSFSPLIVGQLHPRCSTTRMGSCFLKSQCSAAGLLLLRSPLFYPSSSRPSFSGKPPLKDISKNLPKPTNSSPLLIAPPNIVSSSSANPHPNNALVPFTPSTALTTRISPTPSHPKPLSSENSKLTAGERNTFSRTKTRIENGDKTINDMDILMQLQYIQKNTAISNKEKELLLVGIQDYIHLLKKEKTLDIIIIDFLDNMQKQVSHLINSTNSQQLIDITPKIELQDLIVYSTIRDIVNNKNSTNTLTDQQLEHLLLFVQNLPETFIQSKESILSLLKQYFDSYPSTLTNASLFLQLLDKHFPIDNNANNINNNLIPTNINNTLQTDINNNPTIITLDDIRAQFSDKELSLKAFYNWNLYLEKRDVFKDPFTDEELDFHHKVLKYYEKHAPDKETILASSKNKEQSQNIQHTLPSNLNKILNKKNLTFQDYEDDIKLLTDMLKYIENNPQMSLDNIKQLTVNLNLARNDAETKELKLKQETYSMISKNSKELNIKTIDQKPSKDFILNKIKNKDYIIIKEVNELYDHDLIQHAVFSHKSLIIDDSDNSGKKFLLRIGFYTSSESKHSFSISKTQEFNKDPTLKNKTQYFAFLHSFVIVEEKESIILDIDATRFSRGFNKENEDITLKLVKILEETESIWSNNNITNPLHLTAEFIHNLNKFSVLQKLKLLQDDYNNIKKIFDGYSKKEQEKTLSSMEKKKHNYLLNKENQKYSKYLSEELKEAQKATKLFNELIEKKKKQQQNITKKEMIKNLMNTKENNNKSEVD